MIRWLRHLAGLAAEYRRLVAAERVYQRKLALQFAKAEAEARAVDTRRSGGEVQTPPRQVEPKYTKIQRKYF